MNRSFEKKQLSRILALDYGSKRTGVAVTDSLQLIASGLTTVATVELLDFLKNYLQREVVSEIVIGQAKRMSGELSDIETEIVPFISDLKKLFPTVRIEREDESMTSQIAFQSMIDGGLKKKQRRNKALIDQVSATLILQRYMERMK